MPADMLNSIRWDGKPISKPGFYSNITLDQYHSPKICDGPSVSSSALRKIENESPAHYWCDSPYNANRQEPKDAKHFVIGRAMHHLMFAEPAFNKLFCEQPDEWPDEKGLLKPWHANRNVCKEWIADRKREGRAILSPADIHDVRGMAHSLQKHPMVRDGAFNGYIERSGFYRDPETGLWIRVRPDCIPTDSGNFVDFKTTTSVQWTDLRTTVAERGYHMQFALMRMVARWLQLPFHSATLVFVEKKPPYCVRVVDLKDTDLDKGERQIRRALNIFLKCWKEKHWWGPGEDRADAEHLELPEWYQKKVDARLAQTEI